MNRNVRMFVAILAIALGAVQEATALNILVYDENSHNHYAQTAAFNVSPGGTTVANSSNFNSQLTTGSWDVVLLDVPSTRPSGGWTNVISYINGGGTVRMSFWDWDNSNGTGDPGLIPAFGASATTTDFSLEGATLEDTGATNLFAGITMPHSSWFNNWSDDGDGFAFAPASGSLGAAKLSSGPDPVILVGNAGRTIAAPVLDEWSGAGAVRLWENMINYQIPEPSSVLLISLGLTLAAVQRRQSA